jgi:eukaryotic-like serine/threonine-protein kinase
MDRTHLEPGSPAPRPASDPLHEPRSVGEYRILRRLGEGGMGSVYLGYHEGQGSQVAIKVLPDQLAANPAYVDRFYREARSGALLNHPNIVRGLTVGQDPATSRHYLVLEFIDGPSGLALLEQHGRLSVGDAVHIALDVARALEHAHSRSVVHRDIKPDNILITRAGVAKLSDLGLAKRTDEASHLTATRQGFGTPYYMPYEQAINAKHADGRSDIYALGATLYHLVTGEVPFPGDNHLEVMDKKDRGDFPPASKHNPEVPPALDQVLTRMLARDPRDRYQTASELIVDLERSRLAAPVLSFADPDLARKDPWVQACMSSAAQPTLPDLESAAGQKVTANGQPAAPGGPAEVWYLRRQGRDGGWRQVRATRQQIVRQLRAGHLPGRVEASREADGDYRSLASYPEFAGVRPARKKAEAPRAEPAEEKAPEAAASARAPRRGRWLLLAVALGGVILLVLAVVLYWLWAK